MGFESPSYRQESPSRQALMSTFSITYPFDKKKYRENITVF